MTNIAELFVGIDFHQKFFTVCVMDVKAFQVGVAFDDFQHPTTVQFHPIDELAGIVAVGPNQLESRKFSFGFFQKQFRSVASNFRCVSSWTSWGGIGIGS